LIRIAAAVNIPPMARKGTKKMALKDPKRLMLQYFFLDFDAISAGTPVKKMHTKHAMPPAIVQPSGQ